MRFMVGDLALNLGVAILLTCKDCRGNEPRLQ